MEKFLEWWKGDEAVDGYCCSQSGVGVEEVPTGKKLKQVKIDHIKQSKI